MNFVFDNVIFSKEKQGGISNYWLEVIRNFADKENAFFFEEKKAQENIFRQRINIKNIISHYHLPLPLARLMPITFKSKNHTLLYHSSFYRHLITNSKVCEITTIHDFLHHKHSGLLKRTIHNKLKFGSIKRSSGIICVSDYTYKDLQQYCSIRKSQNVTVIYNGVSNDYKLIEKENLKHNAFFNKLNLNDKFLLFVGARSNYKNFDFVLKVLDNLPNYKLAVVGNILSEAENKGIKPNLIDRIVVAGSIPNTKLNILYNYASALMYPSSYEGFGIPVIEAMKAGCPVLALNATAIPEVAGGAAVLFDNLDIAKFVAAIKNLELKEYRTELSGAGIENAKRFDWVKCSNETAQFYKEVSNYFQ